MKRTLLFCAALSFLPMNLIAQTITVTGQYGSTPVMGGEYSVMNNVWGSTTDVQELSVDTSRTYFSVIQSEASNTGNSPASYPFIYKGCHFGACTSKDNPLPMRINQIKSAPFTWSISKEGVSGNLDCSYESWFDVAGTSYTHAAELMVWINYQGSIEPGGNQVATVQIGGHSWNVFFAPAATWNWNYIAYEITDPTDSVSLDLKDFIRDAASRGYLYTIWYLDNMEAGFEIWTDGTGLTTKSFSASVTGGAADTNYAPVPFALTSPANNKSLSSMIIPFEWQSSIDPDDTDQSDLEYIFHLSGPNIDTTIGNIYADTLTFEGTKCLQSLTTYTWYVQATDGIDTTASTTERMFKTPQATRVDNTPQTPLKFSLYQNYPNPFNPNTTISYDLAKLTHVTLVVYDVLGRAVATLVDENRDAGRYKAVFDANKFPSGVYFYGLEAGTYHDTKKFLLLK
jgi:cellulose 1,4-beta-cellobiosidase